MWRDSESEADFLNFTEVAEQIATLERALRRWAEARVESFNYQSDVAEGGPGTRFGYSTTMPAPTK